MTDDSRIDLLARIAATPPLLDDDDDDDRVSTGGASVFQLAAACYGARPDDTSTVPTGFDPAAIALFESIVESAYLVAAADGVFDAREEAVFERIVAAACGGCVSQRQIANLVGDFASQLSADGIKARVTQIAKGLSRPIHAIEALRVASLVALASDDVSDVERSVLEDLANQTGLEHGAVDEAIAHVRDSMAAIDAT